MGTQKPNRPVDDAMRDARAAIKEIGPSFARSRLSLDLRAALINLDASLERALGDVSNLGAGPDQLEVYSRLAAVQEAAAADGPDAVAAVSGILALLDRRASERPRKSRSRRTGPNPQS